MTCECCGNPITTSKGNKGGRPRQYCSTACKDLTKYKTAMLKCLDKVEFTEEYSKIFRGDLFALANEIKSKKTKAKD